jgi:uncharacterized protein
MVQSPCIGVCTLDKQRQYCVGCFRSAMEIQFWNKFSDEKKEESIAMCEIRKEIFGADSRL